MADVDYDLLHINIQLILITVSNRFLENRMLSIATIGSQYAYTH